MKDDLKYLKSLALLYKRDKDENTMDQIKIHLRFMEDIYKTRHAEIYKMLEAILGKNNADRIIGN